MRRLDGNFEQNPEGDIAPGIRPSLESAVGRKRGRRRPREPCLPTLSGSRNDVRDGVPCPSSRQGGRACTSAARGRARRESPRTSAPLASATPKSSVAPGGPGLSSWGDARLADGSGLVGPGALDALCFAVLVATERRSDPESARYGRRLGLRGRRRRPGKHLPQQSADRPTCPGRWGRSIGDRARCTSHVPLE